MKIKVGRPRLRRTVVSLGLVALLGAGACATAVGSSDDPDDTGARQLADDGGRHFRGPVKVVIESALAYGRLSAAQELAVRAIGDELEEERSSKQHMREQLRASAAEIVRSGSADSEQFDEAVDRATGAIERRMQASSDALEELHALLEPAQRASVADALRDHIADRFGEPDDARHQRRFDRVAAHLMLSALQIDKLQMLKRELMGEHKRLAPSRTELLAMVDAFEGDEFGVALRAFHQEKLAIVRERFGRAGEHTDTVLTLLTSGQRELLADLIERGPREVLGVER